MSGCLNRVSLIGVTGAGPRLRALSGDTAICKFSVGIQNLGREGWATDWHDVVILGKRAESIFPMLGEGKRVYVEGKLQNREFKNQGIKSHTTEILCERILLLGHDREVKEERES